MSLYQLNAVACLILCFLASYAVYVDRRNIRRAWKPFLYLIIAEQGILAYGSLEALNSEVSIEIRQKLFTIILIMLICSIILALVSMIRPNSWWHYRDRELRPRHHHEKGHAGYRQVLVRGSRRSAQPADTRLDAA